MPYHHLALAAKDMAAIHHFYEGIMGFELVKVEIAPVMGGGWGKHFFYRMDGDDSRFIAFWELNDTPNADAYEYDINAAANMPMATNHYSFSVATREQLEAWRDRWTEHGLDVLEIDHNWCRSIYTRDPNHNMVEFCLTTGSFTPEDRARALAALTERTMYPSPPPAAMQHWPGAKPPAATQQETSREQNAGILRDRHFHLFPLGSPYRPAHRLDKPKKSPE